VRDHYLLHFVAEGKGTLQMAKETLTIEAGALFLIRPSEVVSYIADAKNPWEYYWVGFNGTEAHRLINLTPFFQSGRVLYLDEALGLKQLLVEIYESRGNLSANEAKMIGGLYRFLGTLIETSERQQNKTAPTKQYVEQAIKYISRNYSSEISIEDVASAVRISPSHLYRIFSVELGMPPAQFLIRYRINEACSLLRNSDLSIGEVGASTGFNDPLYFSRVFKKMKGMSPRSYIKKVEEAKNAHL
ncbi:MAG: AraC family transcriptional regulator, partial [Oscillospiraceae bacterium]